MGAVHASQPWLDLGMAGCYHTNTPGRPGSRVARYHQRALCLANTHGIMAQRWRLE